MDKHQEKRLRELAQSSVVGADIRAALDEIDALRNRRTEPSPAEVGSEGLPVLFEEAMQLSFDLYGTPADMFPNDNTWALWQHKKATRLFEAMQKLRQALSQPSPARVEGELTFDIIEELLPEGVLANSGEMIVSAQMLHDFAYRIERALNQRLAVKPKDDGVDRAKPEVAEPVSDDQQAKDAARYRWLRKRVGVMRDGAVFFPGGYSKITKEDESVTDRAIDAALSTTKQEEAR